MLTTIPKTHHETDSVLISLGIDINQQQMTIGRLIECIRLLAPYVKGRYSDIANNCGISRQHLSSNVFRGKCQKLETLIAVWHHMKKEYIERRKIRSITG